MISNFKNKSFFNKIKDKWQRRNKGNFMLLAKNYYLYFMLKIFQKQKFKRRHIISQISKNSIVGEIGVWRGEFSKIILKHCKPKKLILIDPWLYDQKIRGCAPQVKGKEPINQKYFDEAYNETKKTFINNSNVEIIKNNSLESSKNFNDEYFDFIYIDAEHSYDAVKQDLNCWYPKLKKNGYIFGDDYHWREEDNSFSVEKAYQEFFNLNKIKHWCVFKSQVMFQKK
tara:strand:+ start:780 stop:1460 length:681 start_codon:yes stop_codon:yes gene_type:complete